MSPLVLEWNNNTQININIEKADVNDLIGYSVSLSSDGNTLAVGGHTIFHLYSYLQDANDGNGWTKVFDFTEMTFVLNMRGDLSYKKEVSLSLDGHHVAVGDMFASSIDLNRGSVMVFSNVDTCELVQWYQIGATIHEDKETARFGTKVDIADDGKRFAASTVYGSQGAVYDYNGSEWIEKLKIDDSFSHDDGSIALSPNGQFFAVKMSFHNVVDIYELTAFTKIHTLIGMGANDFGYSISFSYDGSILAISSWSIGAVDIFQFNPQEQRYSPSSAPILVENVTGLGHSVSVSANGKYVVVGAVGNPSRILNESGRFDDFEYWIDMKSELGSVYIFRIGNDDWEVVDQFERDKAMYDKIGWYISVSGTGEILAFGAYGTGGKRGDGPYKKGQVNVYRGEKVL